MRFLPQNLALPESGKAGKALKNQGNPRRLMVMARAMKACAIVEISVEIVFRALSLDGQRFDDLAPSATLTAFNSLILN